MTNDPAPESGDPTSDTEATSETEAGLGEATPENTSDDAEVDASADVTSAEGGSASLEEATAMSAYTVKFRDVHTSPTW